MVGGMQVQLKGRRNYQILCSPLLFISYIKLVKYICLVNFILKTMFLVGGMSDSLWYKKKKLLCQK